LAKTWLIIIEMAMGFVRALVSPMAGLSTVEASIFSLATVFFILGQFLKLVSFGWEAE
jgi:membrane protein DedA with SNARE-associated domain